MLVAISEETGMEFVTEKTISTLSLWRASARMDGRTLAYVLPGENFVRTGVELGTRNAAEECIAKYISLPGTSIMMFGTTADEESIAAKWTLPGFENPDEVHMKAKLAGENPWRT